VHVLQRIEQRAGQRQRLLFRKSAAPPEQCMQRFALVPGHQQVGRAVGLETAVHLDDVVMGEPRDGPALGHEVLETGRKDCVGGVRGGEGWPRRSGERLQTAVGQAPDQVAGQVLLECERRSQQGVGDQVGDAEGA
jgi:hypothetical protein